LTKIYIGLKVKKEFAVIAAVVFSVDINYCVILELNVSVFHI